MRFIDGTLPVRGYVAGVRLHRITEGERTFTEWWADFEVVGADRNTMIAQIANNIFAAGFRAVAAKLRPGRRLWITSVQLTNHPEPYAMLVVLSFHF